jgi:diaminopimelate epimerase
MRFTKMHGIGNDYVYLDCVRNPHPRRPPALSKVVSDRHFGIGSDGLDPDLPFQTRPMPGCGCSTPMAPNPRCAGTGLRCVAKFVYDHGIARKPRLAIETGRGVLTVDLEVEVTTRCRRVRVNMGEPILRNRPTSLPLCPGDPPVNVPLNCGSMHFRGDLCVDGEPALP